MDNLLESRIAKVEWTLEGHAEELRELKDTSEQLRSHLRSIQQSLAQIKWIAFGAGIMYFGKELGLSSIFKLFG